MGTVPASKTAISSSAAVSIYTCGHPLSIPTQLPETSVNNNYYIKFFFCGKRCHHDRLGSISAKKNLLLVYTDIESCNSKRKINNSTLIQLPVWRQVLPQGLRQEGHKRMKELQSGLYHIMQGPQMPQLQSALLYNTP